MKKYNGKKLTGKQRKFLKELSKTLNPTEAAFRAYRCKTRASASEIARQNLRKLEIPFNELMQKMGLDDEQDLKDLKRLREAKFTKHFAHEGVIVDSATYDDNATQLKALELTMKIKRRLQDDTQKPDNTINVLPKIQVIYVNGNGKANGSGNKKVRTICAGESERSPFI